MQRLLELLREHSVRRGRFVLSSGRESDFFVDCKQTVLRAEGHALVAEALWDALERLPESPEAVAGVELGGCSLASAVSMHSWHVGRPLDAIYVRKEAKEHGSRRPLEGDSHLADGTRVALLEDVITTGGSTLRAAERLRSRRLQVVGVVALVDRGEGGADALREAGLPLLALFGRADFFGEGAA